MGAIHRAKIIELRGSWSSGLATLVVEDENGQRTGVACENGPTVRALDSAFGCIVPGHCISQENIKGQEIYYTYDELGICLGGFSPVYGASEELVEAYEAQGE